VTERSEYRGGELLDANLPAEPWPLWNEWLRAAREAGLTEPEAMHLATTDAAGRPHGRVVLLRGWDERGLWFFSHTHGPKGQELADNPYAAATFWWPALERQIRVEGAVERLPEAESDAYFAARPYESRLASAAVAQSRPVRDRSQLEEQVEALRSRYPVELPRPATWGGYLIVPDRMEFWQGRPARLHDRIDYRRAGSGWVRQRLSP
jgi:pyridoxamine 5'-phosphate oxidase